MDLSALNKIQTFGAPTLEGFDTSNVVSGQRLGGSTRQFVQFYHKKFVEPTAVETVTNPKTGEVKVTKVEPREVTREMVKIITPGDKNEIDDFAQDYHKYEFWKHYKAFREGKGAPIGTPIDEVSYIPSNVALELKFLGCHTEEQFADSLDLLAGRIGNGFELREFARASVKARQGSDNTKQVEQLKSALNSSNEAIERLQAQIEALAAGRSVENPIKKSPGRPKGWKKAPNVEGEVA